MSCDIIETPSDNANPTVDNVIGGFTIIGEKTKSKISNVKEVLPYWITNSEKFPADLQHCHPISDKVLKINSAIQSRLYEMGISQLFPVQYAVIPYIMNSYYTSNCRPLCRPRDICICAPTGSGKTLAYAIPIVQLLLNRVHQFIRALIIVPVRDLAVQVCKTLNQLIEGTDIKVALLAGIQSFTKEQEEIIDSSTDNPTVKVDIVVATPGRLVDHLYNTSGFSMERLRILVIDEADRVIVEEKQNWYRTLEDALYYYTSLNSHTNSTSSITGRKRCRPIPTIGYHYDRNVDITLQKILVSATLTHDPEPLKQFNLYFPILFRSSQTDSSLVENKIIQPTLEEEAHDGSYTTENKKKKKKSKSHRDGEERTMNGIDSVETKDNNHTAIDTTLSNDVIDDDGGVGQFFIPQNLEEYLITAKPDIRVLFLVYLIRQKHKSRILCFTNTVNCAKRLNLLLSNFQNIHSKFLSSNLHPNKRQRILNSFSTGMCQILVCTDSMARGMDIEDVECVVSYDIPSSIKTYIHRIGRTARAGKKGVAYTLLSTNQFYHFKKDLKRVGRKKIKQLQFHQSQWSQFNAEYKVTLRNYENLMTSLGKTSSSLTSLPDALTVKHGNENKKSLSESRFHNEENKKKAKQQRKKNGNSKEVPMEME
ncbi:unnamed protein product [Trichobilharzia szidati]|nr:unnamed protein product [Trichobilharzia szidati]